MAFPIAAVIAAGAGIVNSLLAAQGASNQQNLSFDQQRQLMWEQQDYQDSVNDKAMAFQREMNQRNIDWNTESNVRQRIEAAGYNPYLYQNGAMSANVNSSIPLSSSASVPPASVLPDPLTAFSSTAVQSIKGVADIIQSGQQSSSIAADTAAKQYNLSRQQAKDSRVIGNRTLPQIEVDQAYYNYARAFDLSVQEDVATRVARCRDTLNNAIAYDENGKPITDESGNYLSNLQVSTLTEFRRQTAEYRKVLAEMDKIKTESDLNKVQKQINDYNFKYLQPAQLANLQATLDQIHADIRVKQASADYVKQQFHNEILRGRGIDISNQIASKDLENYDVDKWFRRFGLASESGQNAAAAYRYLKLAKFAK